MDAAVSTMLEMELYSMCHSKVSAERLYKRLLPFIQYARARTC